MQTAPTWLMLSVPLPPLMVSSSGSTSNVNGVVACVRLDERSVGLVQRNAVLTITTTRAGSTVDGGRKSARNTDGVVSKTTRNGVRAESQ